MIKRLAPRWGVLGTILVGLACAPLACGSSDSCEDARNCSAGTGGESNGDGGPEAGADAALLDAADASEVEGNFSISADAGPLFVTQGGSLDIDVTITRENGSTEAVVVNAVGLASGTLATTAVASGTASTATLTVSATDAALQGSTAIKIKAVGSESGLTHEVDTEIFVRGRPGMLDTTFGKQGFVEAHAGGVDSVLYDVVVLSDDSIFVMGYVGVGANGSTKPNGCAFAKFTPDGEPEFNYGLSGTLHAPIVAGEYAQVGLDQGPKGTVVVVGNSETDAVLLRRYKPDGSIDTAFGASGVTSIPAAAKSFTATRVFVQSDTKFVLVGTISGPSNNSQFAALRFTSEGQLDSSYGIAGLLTAATTQCENVRGATQLADESIVATGESYACTDPDTWQPVVVKTLETGTFDTTFGNGGKALPFYPTHGPGLSVLPLSNSNLLLLSGKSVPIFSALDTSGKDTKSLGEFGYFYLAATVSQLVLQPDGNILAAGSLLGQISFARFKPDLSLDTTFGAGGYAITETGAFLNGTKAVLQSDGRIVVAGTKIVSPQSDVKQRFWVARFWN